LFPGSYSLASGLRKICLCLYKPRLKELHCWKSMVGDLQDVWKRLTLTEEEETVVISEDDDPSERADQVALCLLGKLYTGNTFNIGAMKTVLKNVWKPSKGVIIKELDWNLFVFQFFTKADKDYVFSEGPWAFDGCILMFKEMTGLEQPSEVVFNKARFLH